MLPLLKVDARVKLGTEKPGATDTSVRGLLTTRRSKASLGRKTCRAVDSLAAVTSGESAGRDSGQAFRAVAVGTPAGQWALGVLCPEGRLLAGEAGEHSELSLGRNTCRAVGSGGALPRGTTAGRGSKRAFRAVAGEEDLQGSGQWAMWVVCQGQQSASREHEACPSELSLVRKMTCRAMDSVGVCPVR